MHGCGLHPGRRTKQFHPNLENSHKQPPHIQGQWTSREVHFQHVTEHPCSSWGWGTYSLLQSHYSCRNPHWDNCPDSLGLKTTVIRRLLLPLSHQFVAKLIRAPNRSKNSYSEMKAAHLSGLGSVYFLRTLMFSPVFCNWSQRFYFGQQICHVYYTTQISRTALRLGLYERGNLFSVFQQISSKVVHKKVGEPLLWFSLTTIMKTTTTTTWNLWNMQEESWPNTSHNL